MRNERQQALALRLLELYENKSSVKDDDKNYPFSHLNELALTCFDQHTNDDDSSILFATIHSMTRQILTRQESPKEPIIEIFRILICEINSLKNFDPQIDKSVKTQLCLAIAACVLHQFVDSPFTLPPGCSEGNLLCGKLQRMEFGDGSNRICVRILRLIAELIFERKFVCDLQRRRNALLRLSEVTEGVLVLCAKKASTVEDNMTLSEAMYCISSWLQMYARACHHMDCCLNGDSEECARDDSCFFLCARSLSVSSTSSSRHNNNNSSALESLSLFGRLHNLGNVCEILGHGLVCAETTEAASVAFESVCAMTNTNTNASRQCSIIGPQQQQTSFALLALLSSLEKRVQTASAETGLRGISLSDVDVSFSDNGKSAFASLCPDLAALSRSFVVCLSIFAEHILPNLLYGYSATYEVIRDILLTAIDCLLIPDLHIKTHVLEAFYSLMGHFATTTTNKNQVDTDLLMIQTSRSKTLYPFFQPFIEHLCSSVIPFPLDLSVEKSAHLDLEAYAKLREESALNLTDASLVLGSDFLLNLAGSELQYWISTSRQNTDVFVPWNRVETCLFVLAAVAPRAPAGKDSFIPNALAALPDMILPVDRLQGLIIRGTAGRLILWTAGYIGTQKQLLLDLIMLIGEYLGFVADLKRDRRLNNLRSWTETGDSLILLTECTLAESIAAISSAAVPLLLKEQEEFAETLMNTIHFFVMMKDLSIENRCVLTMSIGSILGTLSWIKMKEFHSKLVSSIKDLFDVTIDQGDGDTKHQFNGIDTCKLFCTALTCPKLSKAAPDCPLFHESCGIGELAVPVIDVYQNFWPTCRQFLIGKTSAEAYLQSVCQSLEQIFTQWPLHIVCYDLFGWVMKDLKESVGNCLTIHHLNLLKNVAKVLQPLIQDFVVRLFDPIISQVLTFLKDDKNNSSEPEMIGLGLNFLSVCCTSPRFAESVIEKMRNMSFLASVLEYAEDCHDYKLLYVILELLYNLIGWIEDNIDSMEISRVEELCTNYLSTRVCNLTSACNLTTASRSACTATDSGGDFFEERAAVQISLCDSITAVDDLLVWKPENSETSGVVKRDGNVEELKYDTLKCDERETWSKFSNRPISGAEYSQMWETSVSRIQTLIASIIIEEPITAGKIIAITFKLCLDKGVDERCFNISGDLLLMMQRNCQSYLFQEFVIKEIEQTIQSNQIRFDLIKNLPNISLSQLRNYSSS